MELIPVACNQCGAPLQVPTTARFVTCTHCHTQLAVKQTASVTFTEKLDALDARTEDIQQQLAALTRQNELNQLDADWQRERESYMVSNNNGAKYIPTTTGSVACGVIAVGFGIVWMVMAASIHAGMIVPGLIFILIGLGVSVHGYYKAEDYRSAERRYRRRRADLYKSR